MDDTSSRRGVSTARVLDAALLVMTIGAVSLVAMQAVSGDWFPPEVSISQYGVGEHDWMLTMTLLLMAGASTLLLWGAYRQGSASRWQVALPWTVWILALVVMAWVPTNEWPGPLSLSGEVHQAAAVCGLFSAPIGAVLMVAPLGRQARTGPAARARIVVIGTAALSWFFLGLLVLTNIDIDVTGLGYRRAWSLHQTIAVVLDIVMIFALIICQRARGDVQRLQAGTSAAPSTSSSVAG
ncbi:MAG: DUF998 domain-containing protein [Actinomycetota bacterium]|nr:DUF998 domain-containing protein [Actinomycetota bacterium]